MIKQIKNNLKGNSNAIKSLLIDLRCSKIHPDKSGFRFGRDICSSGTANYIDINTLYYISYSNNVNGDIITLVEDIKGLTTGESITWLAKKLNISYADRTYEVDVELPFGGFWKKYNLHKLSATQEELKTYPESILEEYGQCVSEMWIQDGISAITQNAFGVGYYQDLYGNDRITLPIRNEHGELCGVIGRLNKKYIEDYEAKYLSLVPSNRSKVLFGLYENKEMIKEKNCIFVVEAEKSVMRGRDLNLPCVAIGKHSISAKQVELIRRTYCKNIIVAFDEDVEFEECVKEAEKLLSYNPFFENNVYVVKMQNEYVEKGSKVALLDLNKEVIQKVLEKYLHTIR